MILPTPITTRASAPGEPLVPTAIVEDRSPSAPSDSSAHQEAPPATDLEIQVPESVPVVPGETAAYTLTVRNNGPAPAADIVLTDVLPGGLIPVWTQLAQPSCGRQGSSVGCDLGALPQGEAVSLALDLSVGGMEGLVTATQLAGATADLPLPACALDSEPALSPAEGLDRPLVTCSLARLEPGATLPIRVGVDVAPQVTGSLVHTVTVAADGDDTNPANNRATFAITFGEAEGPVPAGADLVLHADGPLTVVAGRPFTYTYTLTNQGALEATGVAFEDVVPSDLDLVAYAPRVPFCQQRGDALTCHLSDLDGTQTFTFTLAITGHGEQPMHLELDPLLPGWPACLILKERTWQHIVQCQLGVLQPGQAARVRLVFAPVGVRGRMTANTASVRANEVDPNPLDNTSTVTMTIQPAPGSGE